MKKRSLDKRTQNSRKKLKVTAKFGKITKKITKLGFFSKTSKKVPKIHAFLFNLVKPYRSFHSCGCCLPSVCPDRERSLVLMMLEGVRRKREGVDGTRARCSLAHPVTLPRLGEVWSAAVGLSLGFKQKMLV